MKTKWNATLTVVLFCLPAFLVFTIFFAFPVLSSFFYSLFDWNGFKPVKMEEFVGFKNYIEIFSDKIVLKAFLNTCIYAVVVTLVENFFGLALALALDNKRPGTNFLRSIFFIPSLLSSVVIGFSWSMIFDPRNGVINFVLRTIGLDFLAQNWLGDPSLALASVIFVAIWQSSGYFMIIYIAGLQSIPAELHEAAKIDGASWLNRFRYITFPLLAPSMTVSILVATIGAMKVFDIIFTMTKGGPGYTTEVITSQVYNQAFVNNRTGYSTAIAVLLFLFILLLGLLQLKVLKKREEVY